MDPQTATPEQISQIDRYITLLLNDLTALQAQKGLENLSLLSPTQIARLEVIDFEVDYYISLIESKFPDQKKAFDAIFKNVTPKTVANLNYDQLGELIRFFESLTLLPQPISASLSAEDRARIVALYEQHLRLREIEKDQNRLLGVWQKQVREYNRGIIDGLTQQNPEADEIYKEHAAAIDIGVNHVAQYLLTATPQQLEAPPSDPSNPYQEFLQSITDAIKEEINLKQQALLQETPFSGQEPVIPLEVQKNYIAHLRKTIALLSSEENPEKAKLTAFFIAAINQIQAASTTFIAKHTAAEIYVHSHLAPHIQSHAYVGGLIPVIAESLKAAQIGPDLTPTQIQQEQQRIRQRIETHTRIFGTVTEQMLNSLKREANRKIDESNLDQELKDKLKQQITALTQRDTTVGEGKQTQIKSAEEIAALLTEREIAHFLVELQGKQLTGDDLRDQIKRISGGSATIEDLLLRRIGSDYRFGRVAEAQRAIQTTTQVPKPRKIIRPLTPEETRRTYTQFREAPTREAPGSVVIRKVLEGTGEIMNYSISGQIPQTPSAQATAPNPRFPTPLPDLGQITRGAVTVATNPMLRYALLVGGIILLLIVFVVILNNDSAFLPPGVKSGIRAKNGPGDIYNLGGGTCPLVGGDNNISLWAFNDSDEVRGHGENGYDQTIPVPIFTFAGERCTGINRCPYYGLAIDVKGGTQVMIPSVCALGEPCDPENQNETWEVEMGWAVCGGGQGTGRGPEGCTNGNYWGDGIVLRSQNQIGGHQWKIYLNHIETNMQDGDEYQTGDVVATLSTALGSNAHLHFEVTMDGLPINPEPFCNGTVIPQTDANTVNYCGVNFTNRFAPDFEPELVTCGEVQLRADGCAKLTAFKEAVQREFNTETNIVATYGYRSYQLQSELYNQNYGNCNMITAPPGSSDHQSGCAVDMYALINGNLENFYPNPNTVLGSIAIDVGLIHPIEIDPPHYLVCTP